MTSPIPKTKAPRHTRALGVSPTRRGVFVVMPAYNEGPLIAEVVTHLRPFADTVIVVDDGSNDDTAHQAQRAGAIVLRHCLNRGQGAALQTGIEYALQCKARWIATFDADGQHSPEDLEILIAPLLKGDVDVVLGSRFLGRVEGMPTSRKIILKAATLFTRFFSGLAVTDTHNGLRAFSSAAASRLRITMEGMAHASEILDQIGQLDLRWVEVPVTIRYTSYTRAKGQSSSALFPILWDYVLGRVAR